MCTKRTICVALMVLMFASVISVMLDDAGSIKQPDGGGNPGTWYKGDTPENLREYAPVLLFVHGLNSSARTWFEGNDMYEMAFQDGYQTAFVDLFPAKSNWDNGELLAQIIQEVHHYYDKPIVLVGHSKGGVDAQTALVHYDAHPYVHNVITLGSPHHGSQLADLAHSHWLWWLAEILGQRNEATHSLQMGSMAHFRSETDDHPNVHRNDYYTFAGTSWGSFGSSLYWGGLYLSSYGENDGAVTADSAHLPTGDMVRIDDWDHQEINTGSAVFEWMDPYLSTALSGDAQHEPGALDARHDSGAHKTGGHKKDGHEVGEQLVRGGEQLVRGGEHDRLAEAVFTVENDVSALKMDWISDEPAHDLRLVDPTGREVNIHVEHAEDDLFFAGAWLHTVEVTEPQSGEWTVKADYEQAGAYAVTWHFDTPLSDELVFQPAADGQHLSVEADRDVVTVEEVEYRLHFSADNNADKQDTQLSVYVEDDASEPLTLPSVQEPGVYNITADISGFTAAGKPFERTIIRSVYVDEAGNMFH